MVNNIIERLAAQDNGAADDYIQDGIRYCGRCRRPKQAWVELGGQQRLVPITCVCEAEDRTLERDESAHKEFLAQMKAMQNEFGISDTSWRKFTFAEDDGSSPKISAVCQRYVERWSEMKENNLGVLFYGSCGTGKSFFACSIVNALLEKNVRAAVTNFPRLLNLLQGEREKQTLIDHLQRYELLVIDDLGVERDSAYALEQVFGVIDARARSSLPLVVTTNLSLGDLKSPTSMQQARIYDRVLELCPITIKMTGESKRTGNAETRRNKAREISNA